MTFQLSLNEMYAWKDSNIRTVAGVIFKKESIYKKLIVPQSGNFFPDIIYIYMYYRTNIRIMKDGKYLKKKQQSKPS